MNAPGRLHNLSQEIDGDKETWQAYSSHFVKLASNAVERRSVSASQSVTPSPQKRQKVAKPTLHSWTLRLCQTIKSSSGRGEAEADDSETEEDEDNESDNSLSQSIAWYGARFSLSKSQALIKDSGESSWEMLELRIKVAWDSGAIDVMAVESNRAEDGTYSSVKLAFDSADGEKEGEEEVTPKEKVEVLLHRLNASEVVKAATTIASDFAKAFNVLKGQTQTLKQERDGHRKLLQNNRRHERHKEGTSSIVNPGRMQRKTQDDEGFEGDEEQEEV